MTNLARFDKRIIKQLLKRVIFVQNKILLGTHHKTGTVWIGSIFREISMKFGLKFISHHLEKGAPDGRWDIFHNTHSVFNLAKLGHFRGLHMIRDPRDQLISATFYHEKSVEPWLHSKRQEFGGLTYQEKISSYSSFDDKILFEMEHSAYDNIMSMMNFDYSDSRFLTVKYEDLIKDFDLKHFEQIFGFLGFRKISIGWCLVAAYRNSLFSGSIKSPHHVRSGKARQWPEYLKPIHKKRFDALFGDVLDKLGYDDREWDNLSK